MVKRHLKRLAAPKSWTISKKEYKYIKRPFPGAHSFMLGMTLNVFIRDVLGYAQNTKEVKTIINEKGILINQKPAKDVKNMVGFMDTVSFPKLKKNYRILLNNKGKLLPIEIKDGEAKIKIAKIINKTILKGNKVQVNLSDGRNVIVEKDSYSTGDSAVIELPENNIKEAIKLEKGSSIILIGGKHIGDIGVINELDENEVIYKSGSEDLKTLKKYAYVIGKGKPIIEVPKKD